MKRKRYKRREAIQFRTGAPLLYGANRMLPRTQERVPRSIVTRPLMAARRVAMPSYGMARFVRRFPAKPVLPLHLRRKPLVGATLSSRKVMRRFSFQSPFAYQYAQLRAVGAMVRNPEKVGMCLKRKLRREVLFAFKLAGYPGSGPGRRKSYRRNADSLHGC